MTFDDLLLRSRPTRSALRAALADAFELRVEDVGIVESSMQSTGAARVRCVVNSVAGEFECLITISLDDDIRPPERTFVARKLSSLLRVVIFVGDDSENPFTGLVIDGVTERSASLDPDAEEDGEYRLFRTDAG